MPPAPSGGSAADRAMQLDALAGKRSTAAAPAPTVGLDAAGDGRRPLAVSWGSGGGGRERQPGRGGGKAQAWMWKPASKSKKL